MTIGVLLLFDKQAGVRRVAVLGDSSSSTGQELALLRHLTSTQRLHDLIISRNSQSEAVD
jgi:hypothetical protein